VGIYVFAEEWKREEKEKNIQLNIKSLKYVDA